MKVRNRMLEREYTLKDERDLPESERTIFKIKGLSYDCQVRLQSQMAPTMKLPAGAVGGSDGAWEEAMKSSSVEMVLSAGGAAMQFDILQEGLIDVIGLIDADTGEEVPFPKNVSSASKKKAWFASWLPENVRIEISNEIQKGSILSEDDIKN